MSAFKQNVTKALDYLDIDKSGSVNKAEFVQGIKKIVKDYDDAEFETLFTIIARRSDARDVPNSQMIDHFDKFL